MQNLDAKEIDLVFGGSTYWLGKTWSPTSELGIKVENYLNSLPDNEKTISQFTPPTALFFREMLTDHTLAYWQETDPYANIDEPSLHYGNGPAGSPDYGCPDSGLADSTILD